MYLILPFYALSLIGSTNLQEEDTASEFVNKWADSFNQNDVNKQLQLYDPSKKLVVIVSAGIKYSGYMEYATINKQQFSEVEFYESVAKKITVREIKGSFIVNFEHELKLKSKSDDSKWKAHIRTAMVLEQTKGKLRIVYEHSSPIAGIDRLTQID